MSKLVVNTYEIATYFKDVHRHFSEQEEVISGHLSIYRKARDTLAAEDLSAIEHVLAPVEQLGKKYVDDMMPFIHDMYYTGRPLEPYQDALLAINHFLTDHEITPFIKEIDKIHAADQTAEVEGTKGMTPEELAKEALYEAGEFAGINDFYRAIFGEEPIFEQEISKEEWEESVAWGILTIFPPSRLSKHAKMGKVGRGVKGTIKGTRAAKRFNATKETVARIKEYANRLKKDGQLTIRRGNEGLKVYAKRLENNLKKNRPQVAKVHKDAGDTLRLKKGDNWRDSGEGTKKGSTGGTEKSTNVPKVKTELFKNGRVTVESIKENRAVFSKKTVREVADILKDAGYEVSIKDSKRTGSKAKIIKIINPGNGRNITQVQVSPSSRRHGPNPYIKVSTDDLGIIKVVDGPENLYKTDGKEKATIIFTGRK